MQKSSLQTRDNSEVSASLPLWKSANLEGRDLLTSPISEHRRCNDLAKSKDKLASKIQCSSSLFMIPMETNDIEHKTLSARHIWHKYFLTYKACKTVPLVDKNVSRGNMARLWRPMAIKKAVLSSLEVL